MIVVGWGSADVVGSSESAEAVQNDSAGEAVGLGPAELLKESQPGARSVNEVALTVYSRKD